MLTAFLLLLAQAVQPTDLPVRVGGWEVAQQESSCTLATAFRSGTVMKIEYYPREDDYFLLLAEPAWPKLVDGRRYPVDVWGRHNSRVMIEGRGLREEGASHVAMYAPVVPRLYRRNGMALQSLSRPQSAADTKSLFEAILLDSDRLTISGGGGHKRTVSLSDTAPAFRALAQCADRVAGRQTSLLTRRLDAREID